MKKTVVAALALLSSLSAAPLISVDQKEFDFGTIQEGNGIIEHAFKVTNIGDETLKIQKVKPGCSCTVVKFDDELEPGETSEIVAGLKINGRTGKQNKPITVISNAENVPILRLTMKTYIAGAINMDRKYGIFRYDTKNKTIVDSIELTSAKEDLKITEAYYLERGREDAVKIDVPVEIKKLKKKNGDYSVYKMIFRFKPVVTNSQAGTIFFKTNHEKKTDLEFRCMIETKDFSNN